MWLALKGLKGYSILYICSGRWGSTRGWGRTWRGGKTEEKEKGTLFFITCLLGLSVHTIFTLSIWTPSYHTSFKNWTGTIYNPMLCPKIPNWVANSVDPDEKPWSVASRLGLHSLLRPVCLNTYGDYGSYEGQRKKMTYNCVGLDKRDIHVTIFFIFLHENICCCYWWFHWVAKVCFHGEIKEKIVPDTMLFFFFNKKAFVFFVALLLVRGGVGNPVSGSLSVSLSTYVSTSTLMFKFIFPRIIKTTVMILSIRLHLGMTTPSCILFLTSPIISQFTDL